ncbi:aldo/keto reductase [Pendulispora rubella]|uniref:Aldo/keto reductase n=1 Tax=Pendulispora rubella TaxID=2741070 RepID=A0ABZ2L0J9_9BACT
MRYVLLGRSGLKVSELCLGAMTFGTDWGWGADDEVSQAVYRRFREAGGNFIDTANLYTNGASERIVGACIRNERDRVVLATKYTCSTDADNPNASGNARKNMVRAVEASLRRLGTDYIDLYWLHAWSYTTPVDEVMRALDDLVRQGKILYVGVSDTPAWIVSQANTLAELRGWTSFIATQIEYSLVERTVERELLPMSRALDIGVLAWSPLAGGVLTGKYNAKNASHAATRHEAMPLPNVNERALGIAAVVQDVARDAGYEPAAVALAWLRAQGVLPIVGARTPEQLASNLTCLEVKLDAAQLARLDEVSRIAMGFPYDVMEYAGGVVHGRFYAQFDTPHRAGLPPSVHASFLKAGSAVALKSVE